MDPTHPRPRSIPAGVPFYATSTPGADRTKATQHALPFSLDDYESLAGKPQVARHGLFRRSFRQDGPEFGEATIANG
jgi:hypothetical protein